MSDLDCRQHWQRYRAVMETIANRFGVTVYCAQKYFYLNVNFCTDGLTTAEVSALSTLEELVMLVSEWPEGALQRIDPSNLELIALPDQVLN